MDVHKYHRLSAAERFNDWSGSTLHLTVPVSNDVPNRFFDALVTGGMPVVPQWTVSALQALGIPDSWYETYGSIEVMSPKQAVNKWLKKYESYSYSDHCDRITAATTNYHLDNTLYKLIDHALSILQT
jgi:hypothetical protein